MTGVRFSNSLVLFTALAMAAVFFAAPAQAKTVVFDECHAQSAGNADWTANGGFSDFAGTFKELGYTVVSARQKITQAALANADILVMSEPNSVYTAEEKSAVENFVKNGGSLFAIADHKGADRNNDGIDAIGVLNQMLPNYGIRYELNSMNEFPIPASGSSEPLLKDVKAIGTWAGTTVAASSSSAIVLIESRKAKGKYYLAVSKPAGYKGRVVAFGDSSIFDDGTGAPGKKLYDGYNRRECSHIQLTKNCIAFLEGARAEGSGERSAGAPGLAAAIDTDGNPVSKHYDPSHPGHVHQAPNGTIYNQPGDNAGYPHYPAPPPLPPTPSYPQQTMSDEAAFNTGFNYFNQGQYLAAIDYFRVVTNAYPSSRHYEGSMYYTALCYKNVFNYSEALRILRQMTVSLRYSVNRPLWFFAAAEVCETASWFRDAAVWCEEFAREYPGHERAAEALYRAGVAYEKARDTANAVAAYQRVCGSYPYSPYAGWARTRLQAFGYNNY